MRNHLNCSQSTADERTVYNGRHSALGKLNAVQMFCRMYATITDCSHDLFFYKVQSWLQLDMLIAHIYACS